jgi:hypothetical protein
LKHFFKTYSPKESESKSIYSTPESKNVLSLALDSQEPEIVWLILDNGLASTQDISSAWTWVSSEKGAAVMKAKSIQKGTANEAEKIDDIMKLLMRFGGFTPPPTPKATMQEEQEKWGSGVDSSVGRDQPSEKETQQSNVCHPPLERLPLHASQSNGVPPKQPKGGRGRGRGRWHGRGRK